MFMIREFKGVTGLVLFFAAMFFNMVPADADTTVTLSKWLEDVKISGDLRLRHEVFDKRTPGQVDRTRQRYRLRINTDFKIPYKVNIKMTFASGTGEQVSTNQSFDNFSSQKDIWIDKAYVVWAPLDVFKFQGGKMENPFWRPYTSDVVWDTDFNPEGFSESYSQLLGPVNVFVTALQMVVDEDSGHNNGTAAVGSQKDQWLLAEQIGTEFRLPLESRAKVAYAYYDWKNERYGTFGQTVQNEGNRRVGVSTGPLANNFNVHEVTAQLSSWVGKCPIKLQGTWIRNTGVLESFALKEDRGYQFGTIIGEAKNKNTVELGVFHKSVGTDATVADLSDSDFGDGGTNRVGNIFWVSYAPQEWMLFQLKYFDTEVKNVAITGDNRSPSTGRDDIRRAQLDWTVRF